MTSNEIPLGEAIEHCLEPELWAGFAARYPNRQGAIAALRTAAADPPSLAYTRNQVAALPDGSGAEAQAEEERLRPAKILIDELRTRLKAGTLRANGIHSATAARIPIPPELWERLQIDFVNDKAWGEGYAFTAVRVLVPPDIASERIHGSCLAWLQQRQEERGDEPKKVLFAEASALFGDNLSTRAFNLAYAAVYARRRGRPSLPKE